jgi:hypothetical protein
VQFTTPYRSQTPLIYPRLYPLHFRVSQTLPNTQIAL